MIILRLENYFYYNDSLLEYDSVNRSQNDIEATDDQQAIYTARLVNKLEILRTHYHTIILTFSEMLLEIAKKITMDTEMQSILYQNIILI